ncbi:MAG: sulfur dioxygenase [Myxococcota bacterium]|jgi:sulfur dioxygenase
MNTQENTVIFRQLFDRESSTYTYLIADAWNHRAVLIDPVLGQIQRDIAVLSELGLTLSYVLDTHVHADHVTAAGTLRDMLGTETVVSEHGGAACADVQITDGATLQVGAIGIEVRATPGHTSGCLTYVVRHGTETVAFTGDALLVRGCGRTDFQEGDATTLYRSVRTRIFSLPDETRIYPGHDYRGHTVSTVAEEKAFNPRLNLGIKESEFVAIMDNLNLPTPRLMDVAVPANQACGQTV